MSYGSKCPLLELSPIKFNCLITSIASFLFFVGWWLLIDASLQYTAIFDAVKIYHLPGIGASLAMICVNMVPAELLYDSYYYTDRTCCTPFTAKTLLFLFFMASFGCLIGASFILVNDFLMDQSKYQYPGFAIFFQNLSIFAANMLFRFGRRQNILW